MGATLYHLRIALCDIEPEIWRTFVIDGETPFSELHEIIQIVMGWENEHLYKFYIDNQTITDISNDDLDSKNALDSNVITLKKLGLQKGQKFYYLYDFGDNWNHEIIIEDLVETDPISYPICIAGEYSCPPENCGGAAGYLDLLKALKKPRSKAYRDYRNWLGSDFDPESFDILDINSLIEDFTDDFRSEIFPE
jgi:hypothetical protein